MKKALLLLIIGLFLGISVVAAQVPSVEYSGVQTQISVDAGLVSAVDLVPAPVAAMGSPSDQVLTLPRGSSDNGNPGYALLLIGLAVTGTYYFTKNHQFSYNLKDGYRKNVVSPQGVQEVSTPWWKSAGDHAVA